jgi:hypothetical protein
MIHKKLHIESSKQARHPVGIYAKASESGLWNKGYRLAEDLGATNF